MLEFRSMRRIVLMFTAALLLAFPAGAVKQVKLGSLVGRVDFKPLVPLLEKGELSLEDSLKDFERGIALVRSCQAALSEAEQKVQILLEKNGTTTVQDFPTGNED